MNEFFVRIFIIELRKAGFPEASYDAENGHIIVSPHYTRFFVNCEDDEYIVHYNQESRKDLRFVKSILNNAAMIAATWERSSPMDVASISHFRKLLEWHDIVLAARDDGEHGLHFAVWRYDSDRRGVSNGSYTDDITGAMQNFVGRSGLYPRERLYNITQLKLISSCLTYRLENDGRLFPDTEQEIKSILFYLDDLDGGMV